MSHQANPDGGSSPKPGQSGGIDNELGTINTGSGDVVAGNKTTNITHHHYRGQAGSRHHIRSIVPSADSDGTRRMAINALGNLATGLAASVIAWLGARLGIGLDPALAALFAGSGLVIGVAFALVHKRYAAIITRRGHHERIAYDELRQSLVQGGTPARIYSEQLKTVLESTDRFFGDAEMADRTLWPHAFGLRSPAPLWTTASFERCLILALIYPVAVVVIVWLASGHVGPAERALALPYHSFGWRRVLMILFLITPAALFWRLLVDIFGDKSNFLQFMFVMTVTGTAVVVSGSVAITIFICITVSMTIAGGNSPFSWHRRRPDGVLAFTAALCSGVTVAIFVSFTEDWLGPLDSYTLPMVNTTGLCLGMLVSLLLARANNQLRYCSESSHRTISRAASLLIFMPLICFVCFALACGLPHLHRGWTLGGPLVLFLGLITLVNTPFDWMSFGLTRALLRRGLELGGWWPYTFALVDAFCAAFIISALTVVGILAVQLFDDLAARSGGEGARILELGRLFDDLEGRPYASEFWWIYALLLSTLVPSLVNLMIGGASLLQGIPWITRSLLSKMPQHDAPPSFDQPWIVLALTLQPFVGGTLGILCQGLLAYLVIWWIMPLLGFDLLDLARTVVAPDLPGKVIEAVTHHLRF